MRRATHRQKPGGEGSCTPPAANKIDPIAIGLQRLFATVADEPVPDEFMALLDRIEAAEREKAAGANPPPASDTTGSSR